MTWIKNLKEKKDIGLPPKPQPDKPSTFTFNIEIKNNESIPAFGAFLKGSAKKGKIKICLNLTSSVLVCADNNLDFYDFISETTVHELLHAFQEFFKKSFNEEEVESAIQQGQQFLNKEKSKNIVNDMLKLCNK